MKDELAAIVAEVEAAVPGIGKRADFEAFKATISGPNGKLTAVMKGMKNVPKEDKPAMGQLINQAKQQVEAQYAATLERL
ncbi:MAG: phenylalanine--tRNA ligase subunit alpha, partial [Verrucomicrobiota bacterium]